MGITDSKIDQHCQFNTGTKQQEIALRTIFDQHNELIYDCKGFPYNELQQMTKVE